MNALFVTGTGTGVGKTVVSAALLARTTARGGRARAFKPAESGCRHLADGSLHPPDAALLREASGGEQPLDEICPFRFAAPAAPAVAAREAGERFELSRVLDLVSRARKDAPDLLLVEGAGGLLVPFSDDLLAADIARELDLPLLIVARPGLGTINHTLLTIEAARSRGLPVEAVVFSDATGAASAAFADANAREIEKLGKVAVWGLFPHQPRPSPAALAEAAERHLPPLGPAA